MFGCSDYAGFSVCVLVHPCLSLRECAVCRVVPVLVFWFHDPGPRWWVRPLGLNVGRQGAQMDNRWMDKFSTNH